MNDTAKIIAGKPNTQNSQETVASTKLLQILVSCPLRFIPEHWPSFVFLRPRRSKVSA